MNEPWKRVVEVAMVFIGAVYGPDLDDARFNPPALERRPQFG